MTRSAAGLSLRGRLLFLLKDSIVYGFATALSRAVSLITFPLLSRHFSISEYGIIDYFAVIANFFAILFIFGQDSAVARYYYEHHGQDERRQIISQSLLFQLLLLIFFIPLIFINSESFIISLNLDPSTVELFQIVAIQIPFLLVFNFSQNILKISFARNKFLILTVGAVITQAALIVIAIFYLNAEIKAILIVGLITYMLFALVGLIFIRQWLALPKNLSQLKSMMPFAVPYGFLCLLLALMPTIERGLTNSLLGSVELGLYAAGAKVALLLGIFISAFQIAWEPFALSIYKEPNAPNTYSYVLKIYVFCGCIVTLLLSALAEPLIIILASNRYEGASIVVFPLAMGLAITSTAWITKVGLDISMQSHLNLYANIIAVLFSLLSIWILAPKLGLLGVAIGVMLGQSSHAFFVYWFAQKTYKIDWPIGRVSILIGVTIFFGFVSNSVHSQDFLYLSWVILITGLCILFITGWRVVLTPSDRRAVVSYVLAKILGPSRSR